jgi:hypothetical protein
VKPPVRLHEDQWDGQQYTLYSTRLEPKGSGALSAPAPKDEFTLGQALKKELHIGAEYTGLYGYVAKSTYEALFPDHDQGRDVFFQGSRQMDSISRRYYEKELGAGMGPSPGFDEAFGYTEPWRRMVQREDFAPRPGGNILFPILPPSKTATARAAHAMLCPCRLITCRQTSVATRNPAPPRTSQNYGSQNCATCLRQAPKTAPLSALSVAFYPSIPASSLIPLLAGQG